MSSERQARIDQTKAEQDAVREAMRTQASEWQAATARWLQAEWNEAALRAVREAPERVKELAAAGALGELKARIKQLEDSAEDLVREAFDDAEDVWSHIRGVAFQGDWHPPSRNSHFYAFSGNRSPRVFDERVRRLKGCVYPLLYDAGLLDTEEWRGRLGSSTFRYPYGLSWSSEMTERMREYSSSYQRFVALANELDKVQTGIAQGEAADLWDQA
ncbi:MAG TPA: hypothetical protein VFS37_09140 [Conexibacter sp.]|nr:hypothetical protein [Conexibacter sp.]